PSVRVCRACGTGPRFPCFHSHAPPRALHSFPTRRSSDLPGQFGMSFSASGQYSSDVLPNSEQVSFGAWRHGYGYPQGELAGDKGIGATLEINRRFTNSSTWLNNIQPYIAYDWARAWYNLERLNSYNNRRLSSAALGVRLSNNKH